MVRHKSGNSILPRHPATSDIQSVLSYKKEIYTRIVPHDVLVYNPVASSSKGHHVHGDICNVLSNSCSVARNVISVHLPVCALRKPPAAVRAPKTTHVYTLQGRHAP